MKFIKGFWDKIKEPRGILLALFYVAFVLLLGGTLTLVILVPEQTVLHYILYLFSATTLAYFVYTIIHFAPKMTENTINWLRKYKFTSSLLDNYGYRTLVLASISFALNIAYVAFMLVLGIMTGSVWYISITAYYSVLIAMKGYVFYSKKKHNDKNSQCATMRFCGSMFIILTVAFSGIIVLIYTSNMYFEYAGLMIYAVALYTFIKLTDAIINLFKARKQDDLYVQSIRNINVASALVSLVVLQVALFQAFSPESNLSFANGLTGGAVSLAILALGIYMIIKANKEIKQRREKSEQE